MDLLGLHDACDPMPPLFQQNTTERTLLLTNLPFLLAPEPDVLPRSAYGGRYGYELTVRALDRIHAIEESLADGSELRAIILAYSVGSKTRNEWEVVRHAREVFGEERVQWTILESEKLWRVNGRKEQPNPMPLSRLPIKADCRFYVRDEQDRERVRAEYVQLVEELEHRGWDHLGYGVIAIREGTQAPGSRSRRRGLQSTLSGS